MNKIPLMLIWLRAVLGYFIVWFALQAETWHRTIIISLIIAGLLSDVFDGIIARRLKVSTAKLRRMDSAVDQFFWLCVAGGCYLLCPVFFEQHLVKIWWLIGFEAGCYAISFIRFRKEVATHSLASKLWTLSLFATLTQVVAVCQSEILFNLCFYIGLASRIEIILMLLVIKRWTNDIPTLYHAFLIRKEKPIKRHKLFNG